MTTIIELLDEVEELFKAWVEVPKWRMFIAHLLLGDKVNKAILKMIKGGR